MSIQVQQLNKHFNQYAALDNINLDFKDGELVAVPFAEEDGGNSELPE